MTKLLRSMTICFLFLGALLIAGASRAQTRPAIVEQLAKMALIRTGKLKRSATRLIWSFQP